MANGSRAVPSGRKTPSGKTIYVPAREASNPSSNASSSSSPVVPLPSSKPANSTGNSTPINQAVFSGRYTPEGKKIYVARYELTKTQEGYNRIRVEDAKQKAGITIQPSNIMGTAKNELSPGQPEVTNKGYKPTQPQPANQPRREAIAPQQRPQTRASISELAPLYPTKERLVEQSVRRQQQANDLLSYGDVGTMRTKNASESFMPGQKMKFKEEPYTYTRYEKTYSGETKGMIKNLPWQERSQELYDIASIRKEKSTISALPFIAASFGYGALEGSSSVILHPVDTAFGSAEFALKATFMPVQTAREVGTEFIMNPPRFLGQQAGAMAALGGVEKLGISGKSWYKELTKANRAERQFGQFAKQYTANKGSLPYIDQDLIVGQRDLFGNVISDTNVKEARALVDEKTIISSKTVFNEEGQTIRTGKSEFNTLKSEDVTAGLMNKEKQVPLTKTLITGTDRWTGEQILITPENAKQLVSEGRYDLITRNTGQESIMPGQTRYSLSKHGGRSTTYGKQSDLSQFGLKAPIKARIAKEIWMGDLDYKPKPTNWPTQKTKALLPQSMKVENNYPFPTSGAEAIAIADELGMLYSRGRFSGQDYDFLSKNRFSSNAEAISQIDSGRMKLAQIGKEIASENPYFEKGQFDKLMKEGNPFQKHASLFQRSRKRARVTYEDVIIEETVRLNKGNELSSKGLTELSKTSIPMLSIRAGTRSRVTQDYKMQERLATSRRSEKMLSIVSKKGIDIKSISKQNIITGQDIKPGIDMKVTPDIKLDIDVGIDTRQDTIQKQDTKLIPIVVFPGGMIPGEPIFDFPIGSPPQKPNIKVPPLFMLPGGGGDSGGIFGSTKSAMFSSKYTPSIEAIVFNIHGKKPKIITGLETRPL